MPHERGEPEPMTSPIYHSSWTHPESQRYTVPEPLEK
jgi:hypothetical protein